MMGQGAGGREKAGGKTIAIPSVATAIYTDREIRSYSKSDRPIHWKTQLGNQGLYSAPQDFLPFKHM
ncbi:hypothetical protein NIES25_03780 [Nostoc linckia NIES-25]|nr:hypothetical protein NIES25_03780 [Nostoc linckia NIES-25]